MVDTLKTRVSGKTAAEETVDEVSDEVTQTDLLNVDVDTKKKFRTVGFQRMRTDWNAEDKIIIEKARKLANDRLFQEFKDGFNILSWVYSLVREPEVDENGEIQVDSQNQVIYQRNEYGVYVEDYSKLTTKDRDNLLFAISTRLFSWEQKAADIWGEALQSKGVWQEKFSLEFEAPMSGTQGDREARGNKESAQERYFAIYVSTYSRKADAFVADMKSLQNILIRQLTR